MLKTEKKIKKKEERLKEIELEAKNVKTYGKMISEKVVLKMPKKSQLTQIKKKYNLPKAIPKSPDTLDSSLKMNQELS